MVETYGTSQERFYYIVEATKGTTPSVTPAMLGVPCNKIDPGFDPGNILARGGGSRDLQAIKRGLFKPEINIEYPMPSTSPIDLLQYSKQELDNTLSAQILYHKGVFASATDIISLIYNYLRVNKTTVSVEIEDVVKVAMNLIGQNITTGTAKIANATYTDYGGAVAFNETSLKIDTVANDRTTGWSFNIDNAAKRVPVIRTSTPYLAKYVVFGDRRLSGEINFEFENKVEMDAALADTEFDLDFILSGTNHAAFPDCKWEKITHQTWLEDLLSVKATWTSKGPLTIAAS